MDFLFTQREYYQSLQTDETGTRVLVNSNKKGDILVSKPVPAHLDKSWFKGKFRFPRHYLGIPKIEERISRLSRLVHLVTCNGIPTRACAKSLYRLSLVWWSTRYDDMRKHVHSLTREIVKAGGCDSQPRSAQKRLLVYPRFTGVKDHGNGITTPLWSRSPSAKKD